MKLDNEVEYEIVARQRAKLADGRIGWTGIRRAAYATEHTVVGFRNDWIAQVQDVKLAGFPLRRRLTDGFQPFQVTVNRARLLLGIGKYRNVKVQHVDLPDARQAAQNQNQKNQQDHHLSAYRK